MPPSLVPAKQRAFAVEVLSRLRERGFEAYWAGGCVRDELLGRMPKDYDVATNATPEQMRKGLDGNICRCGTFVRILEAANAAKAKGVARG